MSRDSDFDKADHMLTYSIITKADDMAQAPRLVEKNLVGAETKDLAALHNVLCPYEVSSIQSMMEYVAEQQGVEIEDVRRLVEAEFCVDRLQLIQHNDFRAVITFLINVKFDQRRTA